MSNSRRRAGAQRLTAALAALASIVAATPLAAEPVARPEETIVSLALEPVASVLREAGFTAEIIADGDDRALAVTSKAGRRAILFEAACRAPGACAGLWLVAGVDAVATPENANAFNLTARTTRATARGETVVLDRYLVADYGVPRGNLVVNVEVFLDVVDLWFQFADGLQADFVAFDAPKGGEGDLFAPETERSAGAMVDAFLRDKTLLNRDDEQS